MPFAYYARLTKRQKAIYDQSDGIGAVRLPGAEGLRPLVAGLEEALVHERREETQRRCQELLDGLTRALQVGPVWVKVLAARPHARWGELHGLYEVPRAGRPRITLWMRTARHRRVVAFRTFLRTLLHELCHHLDYRLLRLPDSFHTEGFYKRESSLFHQLVPRNDGDQPG
jgi:hypothetical protein